MAMDKTETGHNYNAKMLAANIFSRIAYKTHFSNRKGNQFLLSLDPLKGSVRRDLLLTTIFRLEKFYRELLDHKYHLLVVERCSNPIFPKA